MTLSWVLTMLTVIAVFAYALHVGRKDEQHRREHGQHLAFDSKPKDL